MLMVMLCLGPLSCGSNGHYAEDDFVDQNDAEQVAKDRIRYWIGAAEALLDAEGIDETHKAMLRKHISQTRIALGHYDRLRTRGLTRTMIMAPISASASAIIADDATVVGVGDDVLLIPLALAAIATYALTDTQTSQQEIGQAWNQVLTEVGALGKTVDEIIHLASVGNVADTGIMEEVHALIRIHGWSDTKENVCRALATLWQEAKNMRNVKRRHRIERTQKYHGCRHSRHSRISPQSTPCVHRPT